MVSFDASLPLGDAQAKAMAVCQEGGNPKDPTRADCVKHQSKDTPPADPPRPVHPADPAVKTAYKELLRAHEKKDFRKLLKQANLILSREKDYNDTRAYRDIARAHLAQSEASCRKIAGEWGTWTKHDSINHHPTCRWRADDAGHSCRDGKDCLSSFCEWNEATKAGVCAPFSSAEGCHTWVKNGAPESSLCVD